MSELLGILSYSERDTCFQLEGWGCLDIVRVICSDFQAIRDIDLEYENRFALRTGQGGEWRCTE